jgi:hypothetical protein
MKLCLLGRATCCLLVGVALAATAIPIGVGGFITTAHAQSQQALPSDFRVALEPYGKWVSHARWGEVWIPTVPADWQPYTRGRWAYTEEWGWYWVADEEWGWIPYHYGRWVLDREIGWAWVPGREWGPAWVRWRRGAQAVGWAPLPPDEIAYEDEVESDPNVWVFCPLHGLAAPRVAEVIIPPRERDVYFRDTVLVNRTLLLRDRGRVAVNPGVPPSYIAAAIGRPLRAVEVRPRVIPGTVGVRGAIETRIDRPQRTAIRETIVDRSATTIRPATSIPPPQPLARGERGRLGDQPPRAAGGQPTQPSAPALTAPRPGIPPATTTPQPGAPPAATEGRRPPSVTPGQTPPRATEGRTPPTIVRPTAPGEQRVRPGQSVTSPSVTPQPQRPSAAPQRPPAAERTPPQQRIAPSQPSRPTSPAATAPRPSAPPAATAPRPSPPPAATAPRPSPPATSGQAPVPRAAPSAPAQPPGGGRPDKR